MKVEDFISKYEEALASQDWSKVAPLMHDNASVTFSSGIAHIGKEKVQAAFERNFTTIKSEKYQMNNVRWIQKNDQLAIYLFEYEWAGLINGQKYGGAGVGTSVLVKENGTWLLLTEHLGAKTK